jgi:predicted TPR repeat methyltransferase
MDEIAFTLPHGTVGPRYICLPEPSISVDQDAEWCVVRLDGKWRQFRFHNYHELYDVPGLYERIFYDVLKCDSPATIRRLLQKELDASGMEGHELRVLDLGAGNGMVGEELIKLGVDRLVGADIIEEAKRATERDRPGVYDAYYACDMTKLSADLTATMFRYRFNCLTCVAALGFGDIPTNAFAHAFEFIAPDGWVAFNIKETFLDGDDHSGFSRLIQRMIDANILEVREQLRYRHRFSTDRRALHYVAIVGLKRGEIPAAWLD